MSGGSCHISAIRVISSRAEPIAHKAGIVFELIKSGSAVFTQILHSFFAKSLRVLSIRCGLLYTIKMSKKNLPKKRVNYDKLRFPTKQRKPYFHIINIHTQGYITLNKYIIGIAIIGLPKVKLWATKCVTKRPKNTSKTLFFTKHRMFRAKIYPTK